MFLPKVAHLITLSISQMVLHHEVTSLPYESTLSTQTLPILPQVPPMTTHTSLSSGILLKMSGDARSGLTRSPSSTTFRPRARLDGSPFAVDASARAADTPQGTASASHLCLDRSLERHLCLLPSFV